MIPSEVNKERILLSCLNWGKGHVARCIGLVEQLLKQENELVIAGNIDQLAVFRIYFPEIQYITIPSYPFEFRGNGNFTSDLWRSRKALLRFVQSETALVQELVEEHSITLVISDHRYGFYSKKVPSIFITHQLNLPLKWWQFPAQIVHNRSMDNFNFKWVMDIESKPLAGKLSARNKHENVIYIGHYSRFKNHQSTSEKESTVLVCNGPQPYDEQLLQKFSNVKDLQIIAPDSFRKKYPSIEIQSSSNWKKCDELLMNATVIYAYCGYSTLMDSLYLKAIFELIPTKGQREQEYLFDLNQKINK